MIRTSYIQILAFVIVTSIVSFYLKPGINTVDPEEFPSKAEESQIREVPAELLGNPTPEEPDRRVSDWSWGEIAFNILASGLFTVLGMLAMVGRLPGVVFPVAVLATWLVIGLCVPGYAAWTAELLSLPTAIGCQLALLFGIHAFRVRRLSKEASSEAKGQRPRLRVIDGSGCGLGTSE